jgi:glycosyltransferase involved in cell wall biosynthesis
VSGERRVQLRFGGHVHPVYREQLHAVPPGWAYTSDHPALADREAPTKLVLERGTRLGRARDLAEHAGFRVLPALGYVHHIRPRVQPGVALIHAAERLLWRSPVPYVVDLEHALLFVLYQEAAFDRPWTRPLLERALLDERLRFLLPWSDAARRSVLALVSPEAGARLAPKLRVVRPAVRAVAAAPQQRGGGPLRLLFVGTKFYEKGGVEAVRAVQRARATHDVELDLVTYAPPAWAQELQDAEGIRLHEPGSADFIRQLYRRSHALLFPSHMDTYGVVVGEAMAHGLPVLAPRHLALTELVQDGRSGLLFGPENMLYGEDTHCVFRHILPAPDHYLQALQHPSEAYVDGVAAAIVALGEDAARYEGLAAGALESVRTGDLSIDRRRALLADIYDAAAA